MIHGHLSTGNYQVVHFIGHGIYNEERGEGCLMFVNESGGEYPLGERSVREIFRGRGLSLVFLNSCESGRGGRVDFNKGVAQSLVAPDCLRSCESVQRADSSATALSALLLVSRTGDVAWAVCSRSADCRQLSLHGEPIDWAVLVLWAVMRRHIVPFRKHR
jgi:hypothetical protein